MYQENLFQRWGGGQKEGGRDVEKKLEKKVRMPENVNVSRKVEMMTNCEETENYTTFKFFEISINKCKITTLHQTWYCDVCCYAWCAPLLIRVDWLWKVHLIESNISCYFLHIVTVQTAPLFILYLLLNSFLSHASNTPDVIPLSLDALDVLQISTFLGFLQYALPGCYPRPYQHLPVMQVSDYGYGCCCRCRCGCCYYYYYYLLLIWYKQ